MANKAVVISIREASFGTDRLISRSQVKLVVKNQGGSVLLIHHENKLLLFI